MQNGPLTTTRINSVAALAPHLDDWRELADGVPMHLPEWLLGWWEAFAAADDELWVLLVQEPDGALVGLAPLYLQARTGCATLKILGMADACSHHPRWLARSGLETQVGLEVGWFLLAAPASWRRLLFEAVDDDARAIRATVDFLINNGCLSHQRQIHNTWKIHLPATWDDYLMMLSGSLRKRCRKLQRQLFDSGKIQLHQVEKEADLPKGLDILLQLHAARWGSRSQPLGVFADVRFRRFHEKVCRQLLAQGKLRLAWLECEGQALAVEYQLVDAHSVYAYQAGVNLELADYSPGKLTMMAAIQFALARGCDYFDLLGGDESYKANWRAVPQTRHDLRVWQKRGRGVVEWGLWNLYVWSARRLKPIIPPSLVAAGLRVCSAVKRFIPSRHQPN